jgi:acetylornithine/succinyldiaminopimelate/putrescine aminotransferase
MLIQVAGHAMNVIKAIPPLVISDAQIERFAAALDDVVGHAERRLFSSTARVTLGLGRRALRA